MEIDQAALDAVLAHAREARRFVVGVYHSHPRGTAIPSPADLADASYDDYLYLIVGLGPEPPQVQLFRLDEGVFIEEPLVLV